MNTNLNERELEESYPLYAGYLYVIDGEVLRVTHECTVGYLKKQCGVKSIKNCDIKGRNLWDYAI